MLIVVKFRDDSPNVEHVSANTPTIHTGGMITIHATTDGRRASFYYPTDRVFDMEVFK